MGAALAVCRVPGTAAEPERHTMLCLLSPGLLVFSRVRKQFSAQFGVSYPISTTWGLAYELRFGTDLGNELDKFERIYIFIP